jgi:capsular exopolysaccharide synthesis family protein
MNNFTRKLNKKKFFFIVPFVCILSLTFIYSSVRKPLYQSKVIIKLENSFGIEPTNNEVLSKALNSLGMLNSAKPDVSVTSLKNMILVNKDVSSGIIEISIRGKKSVEISKIAKEVADTYVSEINNKSGDLQNAVIKKRELELEAYKNDLKKKLLQTKARLEVSEKKMEAIQEEERGIVVRASDLKAQLAKLEQSKAGLLKVYTSAYPDVVRIDSEIAAIKEQLKSIPVESESRLKLEREFKENQKMYNTLQEKWDELNLKKVEDFKDVKKSAAIIGRTENPLPVIDTSRRKVFIFSGTTIAVLAGLLSLLIMTFLDTTMLTAEEVSAFTHLPIAGSAPYINSLNLRKNKNKISLLWQHEDKASIIEPYRLIYMHIQSTIFNNQTESKSIFLTSAIAGEGKSIVASNMALAIARAGKKAIIIDTNLANPAMHHLFGIKTPMPGFTDTLNDGVALESVMRDVTDLLLGGMGLEATLKLKGLDRLKIITVGSPISDATELLRSGRMKGLIDRLKSQFDFIILDGPPVLSSSYSVIIAAQCDATLLIYSLGKTSKHSLKLALNRLHSGEKFDKEKNLKGIILNKCI